MWQKCYLVIGSGCRPKKMSLRKLCRNETTFESLDRNDNQCPQGSSKGHVRMRNISFENQTNPFLLMSDQVIYFFEERKGQLKSLWEISIVLAGIVTDWSAFTSRRRKNTIDVFRNVCISKGAVTFWIFSKDQKSATTSLGGMVNGTQYSVIMSTSDSEKKPSFLEGISSPVSVRRTQTYEMKLKSSFAWHNRCEFPLVDQMKKKVHFRNLFIQL